MTSTMSPSLNKQHNFGIFLKKGKRGVLQLDFPSQILLIIQRGHIKKTHTFNSLLYFDSEEDLHISTRFLDGDLDFDADTMEEKHTICRLLDMILSENTDSRDTPGVLRSEGLQFPIITQSVLRDGMLEKKGNTTITTWNRRRVKICIGEFSYFKPGEELALNVVQLKPDRCSLQRVGQNTINLVVNQRTYCFRVPTDSKTGLSVETVRDDWIKAFDQAMTMKRASAFPGGPPPVPLPDYDQHTDTESITSASDISSFGGCPFVSRKEADGGSQSSDNGNPELTASVSVHVSYSVANNNNSSSQQQPKPVKRATVYPFRRNKDKTSSDRHGHKDVVSRPHPDSLADDVQVTAIKAKFASNASNSFLFDASSSPPKPYPRSSSLKQQSKEKTLKDRVLAFSDLSLGDHDAKVLSRRDLLQEPARPLDDPRPPMSGGVASSDMDNGSYGGKGKRSVFEIWDELSSSSGLGREKFHDKRDVAGGDSTKRLSAKDDSFLVTTKGLQQEQSSRNDGAGGAGVDVGSSFGGGGKAKLMKASSMSDLLDIGVGADKNKAKNNKQEEVESPKKRPAPPAPPIAPPPPCVPPPAPPPAPPPFSLLGAKSKGLKGGAKLKQVHWTPVEKKRVSASLWAESKTPLPTFDLQLLESMFCVIDKESPAIAKAKAVKQTLLDTKRAQNLGILFSGFKEDSLSQVTAALSSVSEPEDFQLQKMATLKRCQPTAEDTDLFKMYRKSRESLCPVDRFMVDLCDIPKLGVRIDLALALWDLPNNYNFLMEEVQELLSACDVLLGNTSLPVILRCMLAIGNHLNHKRQSKDIPGFQISSVDKMVDLKGRGPHYSVMTYLVEQLQMTRPDLLDWTSSLDVMPKVAGYSVKAIGAEIDVLKNDLNKVKKYHKTLRGVSGVEKKFHSDVQNFILEYERRMQTIHDKSERLNQRFTQLLVWLGEPSSRTSDVLFSSLALLSDRFHTARTRLTT